MKDIVKKNQITFYQSELLPDYFYFQNTSTILNSNMFRYGELNVQSPSAGLVVKLLSARKDDSVLDACSAPGGKVLYISDLLNNEIQIDAIEKNKDRFKRLADNLSRNKIKNINLYNCDYFEINNKKYNKIILDAPCSSSGVMSKNSDARWKYSNLKIKEHTKEQLKMLNHSALLLRKKGVIVYSTCSIFKDENWTIVNSFLSENKKYSIDRADNYLSSDLVDSEGALNINPGIHNNDGCFAVRLVYDA